MDNRFQKKNYYFLQTMMAEFPQYDVISFDVFDTLLLRDTLFPEDIFKLLSNRVQEELGIPDFHYVRGNVENEVRQHSGREDISLNDIYYEIAARYPDWPAMRIKDWEVELEFAHICPNLLMESVFHKALDDGKTVLLISDMYLPSAVVARLLKCCGFTGYSKLYLSGELGLNKHTGSLFRYIAEEQQVDPKCWLHIGDNGHSDVAIPRQLGITAAFYRCPRDCFFTQRSERHSKEEVKAGHPIPEVPLDDSLEFSSRTGKEINALYTKTVPPKGEIVIEVTDVSMMFNMSSEKVDNMKEFIIRLLKRELKFQEFWALRNVSFSVQKGEKVGLVGLNGSGKSTMLKIVSGVMKPTKGNVRVKGSIAPLIELGAGFDPELSAQENVYLNGAILGYSHEEMKEYYERIIEFSELQEFEDVAIKNFSSGMIARLGFAIATSHVPDILIIDEILSVGDFAFQEKCHRKIEELTGEGATVLFVSHSAGDIISMCDRAVWLDHGHVVEQGEAQFIVDKYLSKN